MAENIKPKLLAKTLNASYLDYSDEIVEKDIKSAYSSMIVYPVLLHILINVIIFICLAENFLIGWIYILIFLLAPLAVLFLLRFIFSIRSYRSFVFIQNYRKKYGIHIDNLKTVTYDDESKVPFYAKIKNKYTFVSVDKAFEEDVERKELSEKTSDRFFTRKQLRIAGKNRKIVDLVVFGLLTLYTVITKFFISPVGMRFIDFNNLFELTNLMLLAVIVNAVILLISKLFGNSLYSLNHYVAFRRLAFASIVCKVIIFVSGFITTLDALNALVYKDILAQGITPINSPSYYLDYVFGLYPTLKIQFNFSYIIKNLSLLVSVVTLVPSIIFLFKNYGKLLFISIFALPFLPLSLYLRSLIFFTYTEYPENAEVIHRRTYSKKMETLPLILIIIAELVFAGTIVFIPLFLSGAFSSYIAFI